MQGCVAGGSGGSGIRVVQGECDTLSVPWIKNGFLLFPNCPAGVDCGLNVNKVLFPFSPGPCAHITLRSTREFNSQIMFHETP